MILKLNPLPKIPYIDGVPDDSNQTSIAWVLHGELLEGAKTKTSNEGSLNRTSVEIQQNAVRLETNINIQTTKINEVIDQVNVITDNLSAISDISVVQKLDTAVNDIATLKVDTSANTITSASNTLKIKAVSDEIGEYDPVKDPKHRTIRNDIIFLKQELGSYAGFNVNGDPDTSSTGSGLKYKVMQNALGINLHETRLTKLEDDWALSDVGQLTQQVVDLRNEMGSKGLATLESVYVRLNNLGGRITTNANDIIAINQYIGRTGSGGVGTLASRVTTNENEILSLKTTVNAPSTGLSARVTAVEGMIGTSTTPGGVRYDIAQVKREVLDISMVLGESTDDGLQGDVSLALTEIGSNSDPATIKGRIFALEETSRDTTSRLHDVETRVGNTSTGLVAANIVIGKDLYGDSESSDTFTKNGIKKTVQDLLSGVGVNTVGSETGIYKLIADLATRIAILEAAISTKANNTDVYSKVESDARYVAKTIPLAFTTDLTGPTSLAVGAALSLSVAVHGGSSPYTYQWKVGTTNIGTNSPSFSINSVTEANSGSYSVVVTDSNGNTITSSTLALTVHQ